MAGIDLAPSRARRILAAKAYLQTISLADFHGRSTVRSARPANASLSLVDIGLRLPLSIQQE